VSQGLWPSGFYTSDREKERVMKRTGGSRRSERQGDMERGEVKLRGGEEKLQ